jgi:MSHA pilin protein MshC
MSGMTLRGFTLVELVMTMLIVGVLAIAIAPRFFDRQGFEDRGFYDETVAVLRYAQKQAVAQRRTVCVSFSTNSVTLRIAANPEPATCITGAPDASTIGLMSPTGVSPFVVTGRHSAGFATRPADFKFSALGRPLDANNNRIAAPMAIAITGSGTIRIEAETGYVHP